MNDVELRTKCMGFAVSILGWYQGLTPVPKLNPIVLADLIFKYIKDGELYDEKIWEWWRKE